MQKLTKEQAIVVTGYTGFMIVNSFSDFHEDLERRMGRPVWTHEIPSLTARIQELYREDFLALLPED